MAKLVGFKRFKSKKGIIYCVANVESAYSARDRDHGCVGTKIEEVFLPEELTDLLTEKDLGHEVALDYELSGNRAYLIDFNVL